MNRLLVTTALGLVCVKLALSCIKDSLDIEIKSFLNDVQQNEYEKKENKLKGVN